MVVPRYPPPSFPRGRPASTLDQHHGRVTQIAEAAVRAFDRAANFEAPLIDGTVLVLKRNLLRPRLHPPGADALVTYWTVYAAVDELLRQVYEVERAPEP